MIAGALRGLTVRVRQAPETSHLLHDLECTWPGGSSTAIVGASGAGKTTLLRTTLGLLSKREFSIAGAVWIAGSPDGNLLAQSSAEQRRWRRERIGLLPHVQEQPLDPFRRVEAFLRRTGCARAELHAALDTVGLEHPTAILRAYPHELSGGEMQRVLWVAALASHQPLLLLDEPTTGLEAPLRQKLFRQLRLWVGSKERAAVMVTHDLVLARQCDQILVMSQGRFLDPTAAASRVSAWSSLGLPHEEGRDS